MIKKPAIIILLFFIYLGGCSKLPTLDEVLPDDRTTYRSSTDLPPLEVPPDLTNTTSDEMAIPGEEEAISLTEFQRQRAQASGAGVLGKGEFEGEQWIALRGSPRENWPSLTQFWVNKGFELDLEDAELGVMETGWRVREEKGGALREKFSLFTEIGEEGETMLFLSSSSQLVTDGQWFDTQPDTEREKEIIRELNLHFYGIDPATVGRSDSDAATAAASSRPGKPRTELVVVDSDRSYLAIPQEFTRAWRDTKIVLERAGIVIQSSDQEKGIYSVLYFKPAEEKEEEGLLSKLKFWGDDEDEGTSYNISLTGVGDKTEVIITNEDGDWETNADAKDLLDTLLRYYNRL